MRNYQKRTKITYNSYDKLCSLILDPLKTDNNAFIYTRHIRKKIYFFNSLYNIKNIIFLDAIAENVKMYYVAQNKTFIYIKITYLIKYLNKFNNIYSHICSGNIFCKIQNINKSKNISCKLKINNISRINKNYLLADISIILF